jgi:hypothetical protein
MFRLSNSPAEDVTDVANLGDRTLAVFYCDDYIFTTYTIGTVDAGYQPNLNSRVTIG